MKQIVLRYLKPYFPRMGVGFLIKFFGTIMDLCIPYILAYIIDSIIPLRQKKLILFWGMLMIVCSFLAVIFNIAANRMASRVASDATEVIRHDLFHKTMYLSNRQTDGFTKPSLISRMTTDTYNLHQMIGRIQRLGVRAPILLIGGICVTFTLDAPMACVLLAILPLLGFITVYVSRRSIPMYGSLQEASDRFVRMVREDIAGIRVIKALSKTDYETEKFKDINREVVERERKNGMVMAVINPSMNVLLNLGLVAVIIVGAIRVNNGTAEVGKILAFTTYFTIILNAVMSISKMFVILSKAIASGNRIWQVIDSEEDMQTLAEIYGEDGRQEYDKDGTDGAGSRLDDAESVRAGRDDKCLQSSGYGQSDVGGCRGLQETEIEFDHVTFSYLKSTQEKNDTITPEKTDIMTPQKRNVTAPEKINMINTEEKGVVKKEIWTAEVNRDADGDFGRKLYLDNANIKDLSFRIKKGETLGIIGEIGSGKSTVVNLLMRLYDVDKGKVMVSGRDVRSYRPEELKAKFGVVFQNDTIFEDSISGNVTLGREMSREQVQEALFYAMASEFVEKRADKESENLNIKGANLSGGQKQRVLIARALAARPEILILDDSSSALDYKTDAALRKGIKEHFADTTLVIVAQRVSSIRNADHILVLEDGGAIGYGTHEELMQNCRVYREISRSQMGELEVKVQP